MRLLRELGDERTAGMLVDALADNGIECERKVTQGGRHAVWVIDENHLKRARELDTSWFDQNQGEALEHAAARGRAARELVERAELRRRQQIEATTRELAQLRRPRPAPLTWGLIALCISVGLLTQLGSDRTMLGHLTIANPLMPVHVSVVSLFGHQLEWLALPWREPWRLITPVLVHLDPLHIFVNLLMLRELGRVIELAHGSRYLGAFVLVCGVISNIAQYEISQSAMFAGMSGVVYGLLGLLWVRGRIDHRVGYGLSRFTVQFMFIWLVVGFWGNLGIANWCHLFGLLVGVSWGWISAKLA